jgi:hypothetical protein
MVASRKTWRPRRPGQVPPPTTQTKKVTAKEASALYDCRCSKIAGTHAAGVCEQIN